MMHSSNSSVRPETRDIRQRHDTMAVSMLFRSSSHVLLLYRSRRLSSASLTAPPQFPSNQSPNIADKLTLPSTWRSPLVLGRKSMCLGVVSRFKK